METTFSVHARPTTVCICVVCLLTLFFENTKSYMIQFFCCQINRKNRKEKSKNTIMKDVRFSVLAYTSTKIQWFQNRDSWYR